MLQNTDKNMLNLSGIITGADYFVKSQRRSISRA